jgi:hypothetical protein
MWAQGLYFIVVRCIYFLAFVSNEHKSSHQRYLTGSCTSAYQANMRTLELISAIVQHLVREQEQERKGSKQPRSSALAQQGSTDEVTPNNPIFNPRYQPTPSDNGASPAPQLPTIAPSSRRQSNSPAWLANRSAELAELEAQLQTIAPRRRSHSAPRSMTTPAARSVSRMAPVTGSKRKAEAGRSHEQHLPSSKRSAQPSLVNHAGRSPYRNHLGARRPETKKKAGGKPAVLSRFAPKPIEDRASHGGPSAADAHDGTPAAKAHRSSACLSAAKTPRTVERAVKAQEAHMARMKRARAKAIKR